MRQGTKYAADSGTLQCFKVKKKNGITVTVFIFQLSLASRSDGGNDNNHSCKKEVNEQRCELEDMKEKATQTKQSLTSCLLKRALCPDNSLDLFPASQAQNVVVLPRVDEDAGETSSF